MVLIYVVQSKDVGRKTDELSVQHQEWHYPSDQRDRQEKVATVKALYRVLKSNHDIVVAGPNAAARCGVVASVEGVEFLEDLEIVAWSW